MDAASPQTLEPSRHDAILAAAFQTFCLYGFRRTAMEDIARAAGMSRAALYLHFRNKQDIHRAIVARYFDAAHARMHAALDPDTAPEAALKAAILAKFGPEMDAICASPHGKELMDVNASTNTDLIREGEERLITLIADWLESRAALGQITLIPPGTSAEQMAQMLFRMLNGLMDPATGPAAWRKDAARLAALFGRALRP